MDDDSSDEELGASSAAMVAAAVHTAYRMHIQPESTGREVVSFDFAKRNNGETPEMTRHNKQLLEEGNDAGVQFIRTVYGLDRPDVLFPFVKKNLLPKMAEELDHFLARSTTVQPDEHGRPVVYLEIGQKQELGFAGYNKTYQAVHDKNEQQNATVLLKKKFFNITSKKTPLHDMNNALQGEIRDLCKEPGLNIELLECHIARQSSRAACFKAHKDKEKELVKADLTVVMSVNDCESAAMVVGSRSVAHYKYCGDTVIFPSALYHYTARATTGSLKVVFFYHISPAVDTEAEAAAAAASEGGTSGEVKPKIEDENGKDGAPEKDVVVKDEKKPTE